VYIVGRYDRIIFNPIYYMYFDQVVTYTTEWRQTYRQCDNSKVQPLRLRPLHRTRVVDIEAPQLMMHAV